MMRYEGYEGMRDNRRINRDTVNRAGLLHEHSTTPAQNADTTQAYNTR